MNRLILTLLFVFICLRAFQKQDPLDKHLTKLFEKTTSAFEKTQGASPSAIGISGLHGIRRLSLSFHLPKSVSVEEGRKMIIGCADTFLNNVNSDPILRPYLIEYPFPSERLSLAFWIRDKDLQPITTPEVLYSVQLYKNEIEYNTLKKKSPYERDAEKVLMHSETYEEAKRILKDA